MAEYIRKKSSGLAVLLSFFWCGLGQVYNGRVVWGLILMVIYPFCIILLVKCILGVIGGTEEEAAAKGLIAIIFGIITLMLWVYGMINAREVAEKINRSELEPFKGRG